jgi:hypothetical protein
MLSFFIEEQPESALYTWIFSIKNGINEYIAGTAGRIKISDAQFVRDALNEYSLCMGESK